MSTRSETGSHLGSFRFGSTGATHVGCVRELNEDALLDRPDLGLWAVADGMGGHAAGDVASQLVIESLQKVRDFGSAFALRRAVRTALLDANHKLLRMADEDLSGPMGSTVVALLVHGGFYACIWAGDSRAYMLRNGRLERISRDHSVIQELIDTGAVQGADARGHVQSHLVTRAVGAADLLELDGVYGSVAEGDRYLLCSDGLSSVLDDNEIAQHLSESSHRSAAHGLIASALARGASDNITVLVIDAGVR